MKTKHILSILLVLFLAVIAYTLYNNKKEINAQQNVTVKELVVPIKTDTISVKDISESLSITGEIKGWEEVVLVAESQGSIKNINFQEGDKVSKGQTIAKIDAISLNTQLQSAKASYNKTLKDLERYERLEKVGAVSKTQVEDLKVQLNNAQSNISQIQQQLQFTNIKSPITGIVNEIFIEETGFVMPGNQVAEVIQIDKLKLVVKVSETDLSQIQEKQLVNIKTDVYPLDTFKGKVSTISYKADESKKFKVTIALENSDNQKLRAGMFARANFSTNSNLKKEALVVPREAIVGSLQNPSVYLVKNNQVTLTKITIGKVIQNNIEIIEGLKMGDVVATSGIINLQEGSKIKTIQ